MHQLDTAETLRHAYIRQDLHRNPNRDDSFFPRPSVGGSSPVRLYRYTLEEPMSLNGAQASLFRLSSDVATDSSSGRVIDVVGTSSHQVVGDKGVCIFAGTGLEPGPDGVGNTNDGAVTIEWYVVVEPECGFNLCTPQVGPSVGPVSNSSSFSNSRGGV